MGSETKRILINAKEKALLHVAKARLGLEDEEYRAILRRCGGVETSLDLDRVGFDRVMWEFERMGFMRGHTSARKSGMHRPPAPEKAPILSKIGAQLADMRLPWAYADSIAKQMFKVPLVRWCQPEQLSKIVAALAYRQKKTGGAA